jgi:hypothetical protein
MGLLAALDFYMRSEPRGLEHEEAEYRLYSWGEIFRPFLGDREHAIAARHTLTEFPRKLFCSSTPYSQLPQKLCAIFRAPFENKVASGSGILPGLLPR